MRPATFLSLAALGALLPVVWLAQGRGAVALESGVAVDVELSPGAGGAPVFKIRVPERSTGLRLRTLGATGDVEVYAALERVPDPANGTWDVSGPNVWLDEDLILERSDSWPLESGTWYVVVRRAAPPGGDGGPGANAATVRCCLLAELLQPRAQPLELGRRLDTELTRASGLRASFELPAGAAEQGLCIEAFSPLADVDLLVGPAPAARARQSPVAEGASLLGYEQVELAPGAVHGALAVEVFARPELDALERYPLAVLVAPAGGEHALCPPQSVPRPAAAGTPLAVPVAATVAIFGELGAGSGVVVSPAGHVISNAHVVVGSRGGLDLDLALGFTLDPRLPPVPAFVLELVDYREDLDLALMRIAAGLDGRPLEPGLVFPHLEPAYEVEPALGGELTCLGYPMTGGSGSMVTVSLTRGVLSGFARENEGWMYKTDGSIHAGVSGGACVDAQGRLLGFPNSSIADSNAAGGLGFVLPVGLLPSEWRALLR